VTNPVEGTSITNTDSSASPVVVAVVDEAQADDPVVTALGAAARRQGLGWVTAFPADAAGGRSDVRLAVLGVGPAGEAAARAAADDGRVRALALVASPLSAPIVELLAEWEQLSLIAAADPSDRPALRGAVDAYLASDHGASDLVVGTLDSEAMDRVTGWLAERLARVASVEEVVVRSTDGWELHGTRSLPAASEPAVPGVLLLHSGRSDRAAFTRLEHLLVERGLAVLNLDWRGRGRSVGRGTYFALSAEERAAGWRDAAAGFDHLAGCPGVDGERLAAVGVIHGAEHAARAAQHDPRVRALAILTGYRPADEHEAVHMTSGAVDVLYVTSADHRVTTDAMRTLYDATASPRTRYVEYSGGAIGYQLFDLDPGLEPQIVAWLAEALGVAS